jgi:hypothetical protein
LDVDRQAPTERRIPVTPAALAAPNTDITRLRLLIERLEPREQERCAVPDCMHHAPEAMQEREAA